MQFLFLFLTIFLFFFFGDFQVILNGEDDGGFE